MGFKSLQIKKEYRSLINDVINELYVPVLNETVLYQRAVGFFSSSALIEVMSGIMGLVCNGSTIQLIASPRLTQEDFAAINSGLQRKETVIEAALLNELEMVQGEFEAASLNLLSNLIAYNKLDMKIAFLEKDNMIGMFHEKLGLMHDGEGNIIAFTGSMNESANAFSVNYESIDVYSSWTSDDDRVRHKLNVFQSMWDDKEPSIHVISFPKIQSEIVNRYRITDTIEEAVKKIQNIVNKQKNEVKRKVAPKIPETVEMRPYQLDAVDNWESQQFCGIFDMATGTGKTYTALAAIARLYEKLQEKLAVIIICPYQHLVEQWIEDIVAFGMKPIICYSASSQKNWRDRLNTAVKSFNMGIQNHFSMIATNATFSKEYVQRLVKKLKGNIVVVVDEAHNFGAAHLSTALLPNIPYRLALSATIERYGDEEGTQKLYDYFGERCIEYTLKDAIENGMLTPYYYYPVVVSLHEDELQQYLEFTEKIRKSISNNLDKDFGLSDYTKMLLIQRARVVAGATSKLDKLKELMEDYCSDNQILVYCGATTLHDVDYREGQPPLEEARQIDIVTDILGNELGMRVSKFTSEEDMEERERIKRDFSEGDHLQVLVAIRCLDEGVNIPSIRTAFILASSTNPKEYIQRRGRVLRKYPGKQFAKIYDFVTLPLDLNDCGTNKAHIMGETASLVQREIMRMKDFAAIAENPYDTDSLISAIEEVYGLYVVNGEDECGYV